MNFKKIAVSLAILVNTIGFSFGQIEAGKSINITIAGVPEQDRVTITNTYPVADDGSINMPYIGRVRAAGLRNETLQMTLQSLYIQRGIYTTPTIQVIANTVGANVNQETVIVGGSVTRPGPVPFAKELTLWGAVQAAGGPNTFGSMRRVKLTRNGSQRTYDITKAQYMQIPLQRNDTIDVPQLTPWGT